MKMVTRLESVGNVIDEHGVTYPMLVNGGYDIFAGVHVNDIEAPEFFEALSDEDWKVVNQFYVYDHSIDIRDSDEPDLP